MRRWTRIGRALVRASLQQDLEYRANFLAGFGATLAQAVWSVGVVAVIYHYAGAVRGWTYDQALAVVGMFTIVNGFVEGVLRPNVQGLVQQVRDGTFDFVLVKPVDSQVLVSLRYVRFAQGWDVLAGLALVGYGVASSGARPGVLEVATFATMLLAALVMVYGLWLMSITLSFWFVKVDNVVEVVQAGIEGGRYPVDALGGWVRIVLTFVLPVGFITTFPASSVLGRAEPWQIVGSWGGAVLLFALSRRTWRMALRHYTSASS